MLDIDIISNYPSRYIPTFKSNSNLYPLFAFRKQLSERGFRFNFFRLDKKHERSKAKVAFVDSRIFTASGNLLPKGSLEKLYRLRKKYDLLIWFDTRDSTGTTSFEVMPLVDKYCKKLLLKDKELYEKHYSDCRIYSDFYCSNYDTLNCHPCLDSHPLSGETKKLVLGWNLVYSDFNSVNRITRYSNIIRECWVPKTFAEARGERTIDLQSRFSENYDSAAISFHRHSFAQIAGRLETKGFAIKTGLISKDIYMAELMDTRAVLSPFGWGEICFRDFEAFQAGCALIKPCCRHLESWPNIFEENKTYLPLSWEPEAAYEELITLLEDSERILTVALQGQKAFKHVWSKEGIQQFCDHFSELVYN